MLNKSVQISCQLGELLFWHVDSFLQRLKIVRFIGDSHTFEHIKTLLLEYNTIRRILWNKLCAIKINYQNNLYLKFDHKVS